MKLTFRHYGDSDPISLEKISQIPTVSGIVSAINDVKPGGIWSNESINKIKTDANAHNLEFEVVESVPVPEDIKLGNKNAPQLIDNYCENVKRLGDAGVKCICYNFMPVFDWLRSELEHKQQDGANALAYDHDTVLKMDPLKGDLSLPGWDASYTKEELQGLLKTYEEIGEEKLWHNLQTFLEAVIPVAERYGINMAIHPDDPPWGMFGLPRIITNRDNIDRFLKLVPSNNNGLTFCTGSLGANPDNDLIQMAKEFSDRIHFLHLRNIKHTGYRKFEEVGHPTQCGSLDMYGIAKTLVENGFDGYVRPDHGRMIWGEKGRYGYGLFDRALGATYIAGLFEAIEKSKA
ncbi:MAG: mannonate dehydratase [Oscillospiraceae bacterium]|nr:mannonate dehydratase [Candidatus Equicaccousia limihippi]